MDLNICYYNLNNGRNHYSKTRKYIFETESC